MANNRYGTELISATDIQQVLERPLTLPFSGKVIKNRFCKSALSENFAKSDGHLEDHHLEKYVNTYTTWANGGFGMLISGNVMVDRTMREMACNLSIEDESDLDRLKLWAEAGKKNGTALYAQEPVAPSAVPFQNFHPLLLFNPPRALTIPEIHDIVQRFGKTAQVLSKAGFDGIQLHGAHGYLISQFLNTRTNIRTDEYGGSVENRARFVCEIVKEIQRQTPKEFSIGIKLNSVDFGRRRRAPTTQRSKKTMTEGTQEQEEQKEDDEVEKQAERDLNEAVQVAVMLENLGVDFIEVSGGSYESWAGGLLDRKTEEPSSSSSSSSSSSPTTTSTNVNNKQKVKITESTALREAHFAIFAERISKALSTTKIILTGGFVTSRGMVDALKSHSSSSELSTTTTTTTAAATHGGLTAVNAAGTTITTTTSETTTATVSTIPPTAGTGDNGGRIHIDMVGLGRPACHEPNLPNLIMSGEVTGTVRMAKMPGGYMDDVFVCGGNIYRIAAKKKPFWSLGWILVSPQHMAYFVNYIGIIPMKIKSYFV